MSEHYKTCAVPGCNYQADWCDGHRTVSHDDNELRDKMRTARKALLKIATSGAHERERRIAEDALAVVGDK